MVEHFQIKLSLHDVLHTRWCDLTPGEVGTSLCLPRLDSHSFQGFLTRGTRPHTKRWKGIPTYLYVLDATRARIPTSKKAIQKSREGTPRGRRRGYPSFQKDENRVDFIFHLRQNGF